jgi:hypothetical protein
MSLYGFLLGCVLLLGMVLLISRHLTRKRQLAFIEGYHFPQKVSQQLLRRYPHLSEGDLQLVFQGLRDYFTINHNAGKKMLSMPSQVVDVAWHEFILFTRKYESFCQKALGRFLHHTPAEAMESPTIAQEGIKRAWRFACLNEGISPMEPETLPRLFALDKQLGIEDGFHYALDCVKNPGHYCAGGIGCSGCSSCGGESGCSSGCGGD